jgi:hypothetical protein
MSHRHPDEVHGIDGPDYVTLVIEWDALAEDIERGTSTASQADMSTKDADWMIDQASKESFPASDPPAWGSSHAAPSEATASNLDGLEELGGFERAQRLLRTPLVLGVLGVVAVAGIYIGIRLLKR